MSPAQIISKCSVFWSAQYKHTNSIEVRYFLGPKKKVRFFLGPKKKSYAFDQKKSQMLLTIWPKKEARYLNND